jgi:two-component system, NtrC family, sensor kinase
VLLNLYNNAFYAVNERQKAPQPLEEGVMYEPLVTLTTKRLSSTSGDGGKISISVSDNGDGIPRRVIDKIFQPFITTKPVGQRTGFGFEFKL